MAQSDNFRTFRGSKRLQRREMLGVFGSDSDPVPISWDRWPRTKVLPASWNCLKRYCFAWWWPSNCSDTPPKPGGSGLPGPT
jgi:hypothetical protein